MSGRQEASPPLSCSFDAYGGDVPAFATVVASEVERRPVQDHTRVTFLKGPYAQYTQNIQDELWNVEFFPHELVRTVSDKSADSHLNVVTPRMQQMQVAPAAIPESEKQFLLMDPSILVKLNAFNLLSYGKISKEVAELDKEFRLQRLKTAMSQEEKDAIRIEPSKPSDLLLLVDLKVAQSLADKLKNIQGLVYSHAYIKQNQQGTSKQKFMVVQFAFKNDKFNRPKFDLLAGSQEEVKKYLTGNRCKLNDNGKNACRFVASIKTIGGSGRQKVYVPIDLFLNGAVQVWGDIYKQKLDDLRISIDMMLKKSKDVKIEKHREIFVHKMFTLFLKESKNDKSMLGYILRRYADFDRTYLLGMNISMKKSLKRHGDKKQRIDREAMAAPALNNQVDSYFKEGLRARSSNYIGFNEPILHHETVREISTLIRTTVPLMCKDIETQSNLCRDLVEDTSFRVMLNYILIQRQKSKEFFKSFALMMAFAFDAEEGRSLAAEVLVFLRLCAGETTLYDNKKHLENTIQKMESDVLAKEKHICVVWDNFQKGTPMKCVRAGKSVDFVHIAVSYFPQINDPGTIFNEFNRNDPEIRRPLSLTYLDQAIPFPPNTFHFELILKLQEGKENRPNFYQMLHSILCDELPPAELKQKYDTLLDSAPTESTQVVDAVPINDSSATARKSNESDISSDTSSDVPLPHPKVPKDSNQSMEIDSDSDDSISDGDRGHSAAPPQQGTSTTSTSTQTPQEERKIGTTGKRADSYFYLLDVADIMSGMHRYVGRGPDYNGSDWNFRDPVDDDEADNESNREAPEAASINQNVQDADPETQEKAKRSNAKKTLETIVRQAPNRRKLRHAKKFRSRVVEQWNPRNSETTKVHPDRPSEFKESSIEGNGMIFTEKAIKAGFVREQGSSEEGTDTSQFVLDEDIAIGNRTFFVAGDVLTVDMLFSFFKKVSNQVIHSGGSRKDIDELALVILKLAKNTNIAPGDWHLCLHELVVIFLGFYGGFLQCFQFALEVRNITDDPKERYQKSRDFANMVGQELERALFDQFLQEKCFDLMELIKDENDELAVVKIAVAFKEYLQELAEGEDEVVRFVMEFFTLWKDFSHTVEAIREGDSVAIEKAYIKFLPLFEMFGKVRYREVSLRQVESLYDENHEDRLNLFRCSRTIRLNEGRPRIGLDAFCEHLNGLLSRMAHAKSAFALASKGLFISTTRACRIFVERWMKGKGSSMSVPEEHEDTDEYGYPIREIKTSIEPKRVLERKTIQKLIQDSELLKQKKRKMKEWSLWDHTQESQDFCKEHRAKLKQSSSQKNSQEDEKKEIDDPSVAAAQDPNVCSIDTPSRPTLPTTPSWTDDSRQTATPVPVAPEPSKKGSKRKSAVERTNLFDGMEALLGDICHYGDYSGFEDEEKIGNTEVSEETILFAGMRMKKKPINLIMLGEKSVRERGMKKLGNIAKKREITHYRTNLEEEFGKKVQQYKRDMMGQVHLFESMNEEKDDDADSLTRSLRAQWDEFEGSDIEMEEVEEDDVNGDDDMN